MNVFEVLTIVFIVLKICGWIDWSWWWVLAPTWIPLLFAAPLYIYVKNKRERFRCNK